MSDQQRNRITDILTVLQPQIIMNGCCEGADRDIWEICRNWTIEFEFHPSNPEQMAWARAHAHKYEAINTIRLPLSRNRVMVRKGVRGLIATPSQNMEILRSGTWATIREARKIGRPIWIITPI